MFPIHILQRIRFKWSILILILFIISRAYIWINRPLDFTEIIYSYMPYAHLWASGTRPYLDQWYEYPPLTIPLFYIPNLIDTYSLSSPAHINYLDAYRGMLLFIDIGIFSVLWYTLKKRKTKEPIHLIGLVYYIFVTAKANHFLYDTMDWVFAAGLTLSVATPLITSPKFSKSTQRFFHVFQIWLGQFIAIGLKLLNGPLLVPFTLLHKKDRNRSLLALFLSGGLIWGIPLLLYRSSLSVMFVYHNMRGLQVDSFAAILVRFINSFTQSEQVIEIYKNYEMSGSLTTNALSLLNVIFLLSLVVFIGYTSWQACNIRDEKKYWGFRVSITLGYVFLLMIVSKVLSRPFVLWHIPLVILFPFNTVKEQVKIVLPSIILIVATLTYIPNIPIGPFDTALLVGIIRSTAFLWMFVMWIQMHHKRYTRVL